MERIEFVDDIATTCLQNGGIAYFVGGCVRDDLLGIPPKDIDIEVYGIVPKKLQKILTKIPNTTLTLCGESFGILKLVDKSSDMTVDIGIPRKEVSTGCGHKTFNVFSDPYMVPEDASNRRDFTINALMRDVLSDKLLDFHGGVSDLRAGIIRCVNETLFMEDPLRILRAIQFAARFNFVIEQNTWNLLKRNINTVKDLPNERVFDEISKLLLKANTPSYGFRLMLELGLLDLILPEVSVLQFVDQNPLYHPEGNVFEHTMKVIDWTPKEDRTITLQLAALLHDVGKVYGSIKHEMRSVEIVQELLPRQFTSDKEITGAILNLIGHHMRLYGGNVTRGRVKRLASQTNIKNLIKLYEADKFSRGLNVMETDYDRLHLQKFLDILSDVSNEVAPIILGRDIMERYSSIIDPGPMYSIILKKVYEKQLDDEFSDRESGLIILNNVIMEAIQCKN